MINSRSSTLVLGLMAACSTAAIARSGEVDVVQCTGNDIQTIETSPQMSFNVGRGSGTVRSTPSGSLFDRLTSRCLGAARVVEGRPDVWGHCEWTDKDGDKVLLHFMRSDPVKGKYVVVGGSGKFSGITGTREYKIVPFPAVPGVRAVCDEGVLLYTLPD